MGRVVKGREEVAQTTPCKVYRAAGGKELIGWSPAVLGTLGSSQLQPPKAGAGGKPLPYDLATNPGVCPWFDFQGSVTELVRFFECQAQRAAECSQAPDVRQERRGSSQQDTAFDRCFTNSLAECDKALDAPRKTVKPEAAPTPGEEPKVERMPRARAPPRKPAPKLGESEHPLVRAAARRREREAAATQSARREPFTLTAEEVELQQSIRSGAPEEG